jgi:hypothetical protein
MSLPGIWNWKIENKINRKMLKKNWFIEKKEMGGARIPPFFACLRNSFIISCIDPPHDEDVDDNDDDDDDKAAELT